MNSPETAIKNGKKGETWTLYWVTNSGSHEHREITLLEDVTSKVMNGEKSLRYMKNGKMEKMKNISNIPGALWYLVPELKRSSSPVLPEKVNKNTVKKRRGRLPSISPVSPGNTNLPSLTRQSAFLPSLSKGGTKKTKRQQKRRKTYRRNKH